MSFIAFCWPLQPTNTPTLGDGIFRITVGAPIYHERRSSINAKSTISKSENRQISALRVCCRPFHFVATHTGGCMRPPDCPIWSNACAIPERFPSVFSAISLFKISFTSYILSQFFFALILVCINSISITILPWIRLPINNSHPPGCCAPSRYMAFNLRAAEANAREPTPNVQNLSRDQLIRHFLPFDQEKNPYMKRTREGVTTPHLMVEGRGGVTFWGGGFGCFFV